MVQSANALQKLSLFHVLHDELVLEVHPRLGESLCESQETIRGDTSIGHREKQHEKVIVVRSSQERGFVPLDVFQWVALSSVIVHPRNLDLRWDSDRHDLNSKGM